jgi:four helix bundle protein
MSEFVDSFRDLKVYKKAFELQQDIFIITRKFPKEEKYSLTDQIRRSSRSIGANIAEAWKKRRYTAHFVSKLTDADGEQAETLHWLETSFACQYITEEEYLILSKKCKEIGRMLGTMISDPDKWCQYPDRKRKNRRSVNQ